MLFLSSACFVGPANRRSTLVAFPAATLGISLSKFRRRQSVVDLADTGHRIPTLDDHYVRYRRAWRRAGMGLVVAGTNVGF